MKVVVAVTRRPGCNLVVLLLSVTGCSAGSEADWVRCLLSGIEKVIGCVGLRAWGE